MELLTQRAIPVRSDAVACLSRGDSTYLHHRVSGDSYTLNGSGSKVWQLCDGALDVGGIAELLAEIFDVGKDDPIHEVLALVDNLYHEDCIDLIRPRPAAQLSNAGEVTMIEQGKKPRRVYECPFMSKIEMSFEAWLALARTTTNSPGTG